MQDIEDIVPSKSKPYQIISASRRTDIPGCYLRQFMKSMKLGYIDVPNPRFPDKVYRVSLDPKDVSCIAWWSKNYGKWIDAYKSHPEVFERYKAHYFNFTINSDSELEHLPVSLEKRLDQLEFLVRTFGVNAVNCRFDPIVHYRRSAGGAPGASGAESADEDEIRDNLGDFTFIVAHLSEMGIRELTFSFCERYPQVVANMKRCGKILVTLSLAEQQKIVDELVEIAKEYNVELKSCCHSELVGVGRSTCISQEKIELLLGKKLNSRRKDPGQRKECNCVISRDVGIYDQMCAHGCEYCYANPKLPT